MSKFLVTYRADTSAMEQMSQATPEQAEAGMQAWMSWFGKAGEAVVDGGAPLAPSSEGADASLVGYSVLEADSLATLQGLLEDHPHLELGTIDVHQLQQVPGM